LFIYSFIGFAPYGDYFFLSFSKIKAIKSLFFSSNFGAYSFFLLISFFGDNLSITDV